jgi:hypothetical protein
MSRNLFEPTRTLTFHVALSLTPASNTLQPTTAQKIYNDNGPPCPIQQVTERFTHSATSEAV